MEIAVKWIYQTVKHHGAPIEAGQKPSLCFRGRKYVLCVAAGLPVRVLKRPVIEFDKARTVLFKAQEYTVARAVAQLEDIAKRNGITQAAQLLLQRARDKVNNIDEEAFQDEEGVTTVEKPAETVTQAQDTPAADTASDTAAATTQETATMATSKKTKTKRTPKAKAAKAPKAAKAVKAKAAKGNGTKRVYKEPSADSKIGKAVAYMRAQVKDAGGRSKLERGFLKDLFQRTSKKCGVAVATAGSCYNAFIRSK